MTRILDWLCLFAVAVITLLTVPSEHLSEAVRYALDMLERAS